MTLLAPRWLAMGEAATPQEGEALDVLRELLPDDPMCSAWSNLTFVDREGRIHEIDLLLLLRDGLHVVELKGWHGKVIGRQNEWRQRRPNGSELLHSNPLVLTNLKAKLLRAFLTEESREEGRRVNVPWVTPAVVMHGRGCQVELSRSAPGPVYGLDGYSVKGVPQFTELLKEATRKQNLAKPERDALVRLIESSGLAPRSPATTRGDGEDPSLPLSPGPTIDVHPFTELTTDQLRSLGIDEANQSVVREASDLLTLIGRVPDDAWEDLVAVAEGELIDNVVSRRSAANSRFKDVEAQADSVGWMPEVVQDEVIAEPPVSAAILGPAKDIASPESVLEAQLREAFGDRVRSSEPRRSVRKSKPPTSKWTPPARIAHADAGASTTVASVPAEMLLALARSEALAGRMRESSELHRLVRRALDQEMRTDWTAEDIDELCDSLARPHLVRRVRNLRQSSVGDSALPHPTAAVGELWLGNTQGPVYSLLVRAPDVVQRSSSIFLSQVIGRIAAARVVEDLRRGRPDGGRIRVVNGGTVISRRDPGAPWFVVGHVQAETWFPI